MSLERFESSARELEEERDFLLRSLEDLEAEHEAGDIDEADYRALRQEYTARAALALRTLAASPEGPELPDGTRRPGSEPPLLDGSVEDAGRGEQAGGEQAGGGEVALEAGGRRPRLAIAPPAWMVRHRKPVLSAAAVLVVAAGICWALLAGSSPRRAGEEITGQNATTVQAKVATLLQEAQQAEVKGDTVTELHDAQAVLDEDPTQPQALTTEGWLLVQTQQSKLVSQGIAMLGLAEKVDPSLAQAHAYRGIAYLSVGDDGAAVPELRWYLAHRPDPTLAPKVRAALAQAEAASTAKPSSTATPAS
jgi:hypothetical protein